MLRRCTVLVVTLGVWSAAAEAEAALRSPALEKTCAAGYSYQEQLFVSWRVEGCAKAGTPSGKVTKRWTFKGTLEVNGMIVEAGGATDKTPLVSKSRATAPPGGDPGAATPPPSTGGTSPVLTATVTDASSGDVGRLVRDSADTTLLLDPLVGGKRKRFVLFTGELDLEAAANGSATTPQLANPNPALFASTKSVATSAGASLVDLPVSDDAKLLGLRVREPIFDALVSSSQISFDVQLALGTDGVSDLLSSVTGETPITAIDGSGMQTTSVKVAFPRIEIPGIGGLKQLTITYSAARDSWSGTLVLDLGDLFPGIDFTIEVDARTGVPLYIRAAVSNLSIPIGATGIVLDSVSFAFGTDPLFVSAGAGVTAGPKIGGNALVLVTGNIEIQLEPSFRLEITGSARLLPSGQGQLAAGSAYFILDADGLLATGADARFEVSAGGVGIGANISGSGAYSTTQNAFNIEASASGELLLGFLGDFQVIQLGAVVSSNGWGTCGRLLSFVSGGIGQQWGHNVQVFTGCDLTPYETPIALGRAAQNGRVLTRTITVEPGTKQLGIELTADRAGPHVGLRAPGGQTLVTTAGQRSTIGENVVVLSKPELNVQHIFLRDPAPGTYTIGWGADDPQIVGVRTARDAAPLAAVATVTRRPGDRPGRRVVTVSRSSPLGTGETLAVAVRTPKGLVALGAPTAAPTATFTYDETRPGRREIVAVVLRDGAPIATRKAVIGRFTSTLPPRPAKIRVRRRGDLITFLAIPRRGAELPDGWQYRVRARGGRLLFVRGRVGTAVRLRIPRELRRVSIAARPVLRGRALR